MTKKTLIRFAIKAVTIQNLDPEGIGIDEILYAPMCPMIVSGLPGGGHPG